jgi:maleate isomerase
VNTTINDIFSGSAPHAVAEFEQVLAELLRTTQASRTTLRLDWPVWGAHVDDVLAEARRDGVASLVGNTSIDQRAAGTIRWLERERRLLIQEDFAAGDPAPPRALVELYGVRAQMLAPVQWGGDLLGWISVHENTSTRRWRPRDISALSEAAAAAEAALKSL